MTKRVHVFTVACLALLAGAGCSRIRAQSAFKDGNKFYREERYRQAIEKYERAVELAPSMPEAHFYLGSSHQALYRPGHDTPENKQHLDTAIEEYKQSLALNTGTTENERSVRRNTLAALIGIYSDEPYKNYDEALKYAQQLVQENGNDPRNLFAMAGLYKKFGKIAEAEKMYKQATEASPQDVKACKALAGFYNEALWDEAGRPAPGGGRARFEEAVDTYKKCATLAPNDPQGYYLVAQFYWDKAFRDPLINDKQKDAYADAGLESVDKALQLRPDYMEAITYKGLLYRVKAQVTTNPRLRMQYLDQAQTLQKQAMELRKEQLNQGTSAWGQNPSPSPAGGGGQ
jgi:tetratricopeptide (TPR) repeat protein